MHPHAFECMAAAGNRTSLSAAAPQAHTPRARALPSQHHPGTRPPYPPQLDLRLAAIARRAVAAAGLDAGGRVSIVEGDAAAADLSDASVVALYLSDAGNRDLLAAVGPTLRRGTRVVSLYFPVAGWEASLLARDTSAGIDIYLYSAP